MGLLRAKRSARGDRRVVKVHDLGGDVDRFDAATNRGQRHVPVVKPPVSWSRRANMGSPLDGRDPRHPSPVRPLGWRGCPRRRAARGLSEQRAAASARRSRCGPLSSGQTGQGDGSSPRESVWTVMVDPSVLPRAGETREACSVVSLPVQDRGQAVAWCRQDCECGPDQDEEPGSGRKRPGSRLDWIVRRRRWRW